VLCDSVDYDHVAAALVTGAQTLQKQMQDLRERGGTQSSTLVQREPRELTALLMFYFILLVLVCMMFWDCCLAVNVAAG
jgi:type II secretory pathway component PulM